MVATDSFVSRSDIARLREELTRLQGMKNKE